MSQQTLIVLPGSAFYTDTYQSVDRDTAFNFSVENDANSVVQAIWLTGMSPSNTYGGGYYWKYLAPTSFPGTGTFEVYNTFGGTLVASGSTTLQSTGNFEISLVQQNNSGLSGKVLLKGGVLTNDINSANRIIPIGIPCALTDPQAVPLPKITACFNIVMPDQYTPTADLMVAVYWKPQDGTVSAQVTLQATIVFYTTSGVYSRKGAFVNTTGVSNPYQWNRANINLSTFTNVSGGTVASLIIWHSTASTYLGKLQIPFVALYQDI